MRARSLPPTERKTFGGPKEAKRSPLIFSKGGAWALLGAERSWGGEKFASDGESPVRSAPCDREQWRREPGKDPLLKGGRQRPLVAAQKRRTLARGYLAALVPFIERQDREGERRKMLLFFQPAKPRRCSFSARRPQRESQKFESWGFRKNRAAPAGRRLFWRLKKKRISPPFQNCQEEVRLGGPGLQWEPREEEAKKKGERVTGHVQSSLSALPHEWLWRKTFEHISPKRSHPCRFSPRSRWEPLNSERSLEAFCL